MKKINQIFNQNDLFEIYSNFFQLFKNVRCAWAEVDQIERQARYRLLGQ